MDIRQNCCVSEDLSVNASNNVWLDSAPLWAGDKTAEITLQKHCCYSKLVLFLFSVDKSVSLCTYLLWNWKAWGAGVNYISKECPRWFDRKARRNVAVLPPDHHLYSWTTNDPRSPQQHNRCTRFAELSVCVFAPSSAKTLRLPSPCTAQCGSGRQQKTKCRIFFLNFVCLLNGLTPVVLEHNRGVAGVHAHWFERKHVGILLFCLQ